MRRRRLEENEPEERDRGIARGSPEKWSWRYLLPSLLLYRAVNALLCQTMFVPDEHWQSLEVAYRMVFGRGYLSWEWEKAIRGYTHPLIFAALYKMLEVTRLDWPWIMAVSPRLLQSALSAIGDLYLYELSWELFGNGVAKLALACQLLSWFNFYCLTRTLSNSVEASLTPIVLYYWLLAVSETSLTKAARTSNTVAYMVLSAVSVLIRPTGAVLWAPLVLFHWFWKNTQRMALGSSCLLVGIVSMLWSMMVDRICYGQWVCVQLNFLRFNVLEGHSALFGTHPWHWYISQGGPAVLFTFLPLVFHGVFLTIRQSGQSTGHHRSTMLVPFLLLVCLTVVHSLLKHKEFRFIFPTVPIAAMYSGKSLFCIWTKGKKAVWWLAVVLVLCNVPMALYFSLVHQRGGVAIMDCLRQEINPQSSVMFLMPCHSTPLYSHLHTNATLRFLECPPDSIDPDYVDETEIFYDDPVQWLEAHLPAHEGSSHLPSHLVMYETLAPVIELFLRSRKYTEIARVFHTHIRDSERVGGNILIFRHDHA